MNQSRLIEPHRFIEASGLDDACHLLRRKDGNVSGVSRAHLLKAGNGNVGCRNHVQPGVKQVKVPARIHFGRQIRTCQYPSDFKPCSNRLEKSGTSVLFENELGYEKTCCRVKGILIRQRFHIPFMKIAAVCEPP